MTFMAWPEIALFHNIKKFVRVDPGEWWHKKELLHGSSVVEYMCKIKLHGTSAAVQVHVDGTIVCQSRERIITPENDNAGFARWVKDNEKSWRAHWFNDNARIQVIIYGEWIGPGVQRNVAVSQIPKKCFAVFAARPLDATGAPLSDILWVEPAALEEIVSGIPDVYVLPWYTRPVDRNSNTHAYVSLKLDWKQTDEELTQAIAPVNDWVSEIEANDPWVEQIFGVKGTGEGLVFFPVSKAHLGFESFSNLGWKAKGEKHKTVATAKPVQVSAEAAASIDAFVNMVLTPARLEQGARAILGEHKHEDALKCLFCTMGVLTFDMKLTGKFVSWVLGDVEKECQDELSASNLTFKQVQKAITDKARTWYLAKAKQ